MGDFFSNLVAGLQNAFSFGDLSVVRILLTLGLAFLIGMYIFAIYRKTFSGVMYSKNFGVSLVMLAMITSFIILPITSNLTLSLGMVGALSIVRFRTAVKDPIDTVCSGPLPWASHWAQSSSCPRSWPPLSSAY